MKALKYITILVIQTVLADIFIPKTECETFVVEIGSRNRRAAEGSDLGNYNYYTYDGDYNTDG